MKCTTLTAAALTAGLALGTTLPAQAADTNPHGTANHFDLQAHRDGIGLSVESTLASFAKGIETGVSTLELDLQITKDGREVVTHNRKINGQKCQDTAPVSPGDAQFPCVGGIDADDFGGDLVDAAASLGFDAISQVHGSPKNGKVTDPGYVPYVTSDMFKRAHAKGMQVIPWTVDDRATMRKLMDDGVDGLITDYPNRLREVMAERP
jgi:glycerophosphoryl diester phosphodiesterase